MMSTKGAEKIQTVFSFAVQLGCISKYYTPVLLHEQQSNKSVPLNCIISQRACTRRSCCCCMLPTMYYSSLVAASSIALLFVSYCCSCLNIAVVAHSHSDSFITVRRQLSSVAQFTYIQMFLGHRSHYILGDATRPNDVPDKIPEMF